MKFIVAIFAAFVAFSAAADSDRVLRVEDGEGNVVRIFDKPCKDQTVLKHVPAQYRKDMRAGDAKYGNKPMATCWFMRNDGAILIQFDDGEAAIVPMHLFRPEEGV